MADYIYPSTDYDRAKNLLALLGTFWYELYEGRDQVLSIAAAKGQVENQTLTDLLAAADALAYRSCPLYHVDNWYVLRLLKSQMNTRDASQLAYDGSARFDAGEFFDAAAATDRFMFPVPSELAEIKQLFNRFTEPSLSWMPGVDFTLGAGYISFLANPFLDNRIAKRAVYQDGVIVDEEAVLWVFKGQFDFNTVYRQYGYVLNMHFRTSKSYRQLLTSFFDSIVGGPTALPLLLATAAITGIPLVQEPVETVEEITTDARGLLIATDQHVYRFASSALPQVAVGDTVRAGQSLTDALTIMELNRGTIPDDVRALAMGKGFLSACYFGDLIFENKEVPLEVDEQHHSGFTYVKFGLGGFPLDVTRFFDEMHDRGIAASQQPIDECQPTDTVLLPGDECDGEGLPDQRIRRGTLAHLLDRRAEPIGEPTAASLPRTINPLRFLVANVLRNNTTLIRVKAASFGFDSLGLHASTHFRKIVPPHTAVILIVELTPHSDSVTVDMLAETLTKFKGMSVADNLTDLVTDSCRPRIISGTCQ